MPAPTQDEVRKAVTNALEQARTPLLAALGAGDLAAEALSGLLAKARQKVEERAGAARESVGKLPTDLNELQEKLDPAELRKLLDTYTNAALGLYRYLAERGETALEKLKEQTGAKPASNEAEKAILLPEEEATVADEVLGGNAVSSTPKPTASPRPRARKPKATE